MSNVVKNAISLAFSAHEGQFRKYEKVPYIQHPLRVAFKLSKYVNDDVAIAGAILHDTLEDTEISPQTIIDSCGIEVLYLVEELTNPSKLPEHAKKPRAVRKQIDRDHLKTVSYSAKLIKLCDRIDNLRDVASGPLDFQKLYAKESLLLLETLSGTDKNLEQELRKLIEEINERS